VQFFQSFISETRTDFIGNLSSEYLIESPYVPATSPEVMLLMGPPSTGKTTWARKFLTTSTESSEYCNIAKGRTFLLGHEEVR
jgi:SpoVK/Ycf46/Vps4 family AAA+-type ATPase